MDIKKELADIGELILSAQILESVKAEVKSVMPKAFVLGGNFAQKHTKNATNYDFVVVNKNKESTDLLCRRIKAKIPDINIYIVDNVIGISRNRRTRG
jgi:hypothetical protein